MKNSICPLCEQGNLHAESKLVEHEFGINKLSVAHHIHWCDACGMEISTTSDLKQNARSMRSAQRESEGKLTGATIAAIRKRFNKLTQEMAGQIFGGGPVAFCKYENDDLAPSDAMENLLWVINEKPSVAVDLAKRHGVELHIADDQGKDLQTGICVEFVSASPAQGREMGAIASAMDATKRSWSSGGTWKMTGVHASNQESLTVAQYA
jgi:HTH-type transcriptional regulator/antitoxin MqsA